MVDPGLVVAVIADCPGQPLPGGLGRGVVRRRTEAGLTPLPFGQHVEGLACQIAAVQRRPASASSAATATAARQA